MDDPGKDSLDQMLPKHSDAAILSVTLAVLCAGPVLGLVLAGLFAPGSIIALLIGIVLFPCAHFAGRFAWAVTGFVVEAFRGLLEGTEGTTRSPSEKFLGGEIDVDLGIPRRPRSAIIRAGTP
jgi:hypothetical protein